MAGGSRDRRSATSATDGNASAATSTANSPTAGALRGAWGNGSPNTDGRPSASRLLIAASEPASRLDGISEADAYAASAQAATERSGASREPAGAALQSQLADNGIDLEMLFDRIVGKISGEFAPGLERISARLDSLER